MAFSANQIQIFPISIEHNWVDFYSGEPALDEYLKKFALENGERGLSRAWVALLANKVIGYYTLSSAHLELFELPKKAQRGLPKYPIPAIRIGRLAVDCSMQGQGFGGCLLFNALHRILSVATEIGIRLIFVDAKHEMAKSFYLKYGFSPLPMNPLKLILPVKTVSLLVSDRKKTMQQTEVFL